MPTRPSRLHILAATAAVVFAWTPCAARAQSDDSDLAPLVPPNNDDLLEPLVPPNNDDLLEPLVPPNNDDLLEPLVPPNNDDLLEPLVPKKRRKPGKVTHKDEIEIGPVSNGFMLVKRKVVDPCGVFEVSWGGRKTCHATEREKWEYVAVGGPAGGDDGPGPDDEARADDKNEGRSPGGGWPGTGGNGPGPGGNGSGPGGNGPGPGGNGPAPGGNGPGPGPGPKGPGPNGGGAPAKGGAIVAVPAPDGFARLRDLSVRLDTLTANPQGGFDVVLTLRNLDRAGKLVVNGEWSVTLIDADGRVASTRSIWMPGQGAPTPFAQLPNIAPGMTQRVRFVLDHGAVRARLFRLSVQQNGAAPAVFDIAAYPAARAPAKIAPEPEW